MTPEEVRAILRHHETQLRERHRVESLALFGSTARREAAGSSDVDLVVQFAVEPSFDLFMDLKFRLEELLGCRVDLVTSAALRDTMRQVVEREAVRVT